MSSNTKFIIALLLNALAAPGLGQLYLGMKKKGWIILGVVVFIFLGMFVYFEMSFMPALKGLHTPAEIMGQALPRALEIYKEQKETYVFLSYFLFFIWIYGILDLFLSKKKSSL